MRRMNRKEDFISPLDLAKRLRKEIDNPVDILNSVPFLEKPLTIHRAQVGSMKRLSKLLYHLSVDSGILISLALNLEYIESFASFERITPYKRLEGIYYCIEVLS